MNDGNDGNERERRERRERTGTTKGERKGTSRTAGNGRSHEFKKSRAAPAGFPQDSGGLGLGPGRASCSRMIGDQLRARTRQFALDIIHLCLKLGTDDLARLV